ncbi:MAG: hypothetical protein KAI40_09320 [Desulfobacterales bacterium]|nr:hypothetical protein [Desulfobacterales bacterium]
MATNSIQNLGESQYLNPQVIKTPQAEQVAVEQQNQKAAETDLNKQAANHVQEAFKLNISKEGATMLNASGKLDKEKENVQDKENKEPESPKQLQTPYQEPEQKARQIVNIIA